MSGGSSRFVHVADDPDRAWARIAPHALHETNSYGAWLAAAEGFHRYQPSDDADALRAVLPRLRHVPRVSVEEFIDGEEYTFDTITIDGRIAYYNVAWYRPRPLVASGRILGCHSLDTAHDTPWRAGRHRE